MGNNKSKWLLRIFLSFVCLTFLFFLNNAAWTAKLPPLDPGITTPTFPGPYAPAGGGFFPQSSAPYAPPGLGFAPPASPYAPPFQTPGLGFQSPAGPVGLPYQNPGLGFQSPASPVGIPYQNPGLGFQPTASPVGIPYQNPGLGYMPSSAPYGFLPQTPGYNLPPSAPYGPGLPYIPPSSGDSGTNSSIPVFNTGYNPNVFPNPGSFSPVPNMYAPQTGLQPFPGVSPFAPGPATAFRNPYANPFAVPYGNMGPFPGAFPQQGYPGVPYPGFNPYQRINPWQQPFTPYGTNINPYAQSPYPYPLSYNPYPNTGGSGKKDDNGGNGGGTTPEIPSVMGHWAGTWEAWLTSDPNTGVATDPNTDQIVVIMSGDIHFHITQQPKSKGNITAGNISGTVEIEGWNVDKENCRNWEGEEDVVTLTGYIGTDSRFFNAGYYYYAGKENSGVFDVNEPIANLEAMFTWSFNSGQLTITSSGISGGFNIMGYQYFLTGEFSTAKFVPGT